jgi:hypothetical protein
LFEVNGTARSPGQFRRTRPTASSVCA